MTHINPIQDEVGGDAKNVLNESSNKFNLVYQKRLKEYKFKFSKAGKQNISGHHECVLLNELKSNQYLEHKVGAIRLWQHKIV